MNHCQLNITPFHTDFLFSHCCWTIMLFLVILVLAMLSYYWCRRNSHLEPNLALCSIGAKISIGKTRLCGPKDRINDPLSIISGKPILPGDALCYGPDGIGEFYIRLSAPAIITAISYEHVAKEAHPDGQIQSAPSTFLIFGLVTDSFGRHSEIFLGKFDYLDNGTPLQTFSLKTLNRETEIEFSEVKIHILSNHGNTEFTCVYRIQVHGKEKTMKCESKSFRVGCADL